MVLIIFNVPLQRNKCTIHYDTEMQCETTTIELIHM